MQLETKERAAIVVLFACLDKRFKRRPNAIFLVDSESPAKLIARENFITIFHKQDLSLFHFWKDNGIYNLSFISKKDVKAIIELSSVVSWGWTDFTYRRHDCHFTLDNSNLFKFSTSYWSN